jgi:hypothetical protein
MMCDLLQQQYDLGTKNTVVSALQFLSFYHGKFHIDEQIYQQIFNVCH